MKFRKKPVVVEAWQFDGRFYALPRELFEDDRVEFGANQGTLGITQYFGFEPRGREFESLRTRQ